MSSEFEEFYELVGDNEVGPLKGIHRCSSEKSSDGIVYKFVQVIDGKVVTAFTEEEIIIKIVNK